MEFDKRTFIGAGDGPDSGVTTPANKQYSAESTLRKDNLPPASKVEDAKVQTGVTRACVLQQDGGNANPKHRPASHWGTSKQSLEDAETLKNLPEPK
jgi:hypothetical protein